MESYEETGRQRESGLESFFVSLIPLGAFISSADESLKGGGYILLSTGVLCLVAPFAVNFAFKAYTSFRSWQGNYNQ